METAKASNPLTILHNAIVITMDSDSHVFRDGAVAIRSDTIVDVGRSLDILGRFSSSGATVTDLHGQILLPGFVNTHVHTSQQLGRGIADDVDLMTWLHGRIWPYESSMTEEDSYVSTLLCGVELIRSGVTCFAEAGGQHVPGMARAVEALGLRACLARSVMDCGEGLPVSWASETAQDCIEVGTMFEDDKLFSAILIQSQRELYKRHHDTADGRIRVWLGIRQIMNCTDELLLATRDTARELNTGIHMHVAEIPYENQLVINTRNVDHGTVTYLEKVDFLQSNLLSAHTVWVNNAEIGLLSRAGVKVSHCPAAAMKMLGFAPIKEMLQAGICVSLGTDGAPSNNRMSIVDEMYLASLINQGREVHSASQTDRTALPAETILQMVTINGARSVLWDKEIGSLELGKKADMVVINPCLWSMVPLHDCISGLVYSMRTENIVSVMCNGQWIMKDGKILTVNEEEVIMLAKQASCQLLKRAGIVIPERMKFV